MDFSLGASLFLNEGSSFRFFLSISFLAELFLLYLFLPNSKFLQLSASSSKLSKVSYSYPLDLISSCYSSSSQIYISSGPGRSYYSCIGSNPFYYRMCFCARIICLMSPIIFYWIWRFIQSQMFWSQRTWFFIIISE